MAHIDFVSKLHKKTTRNYLERVCEHDKIECATVAKQYGEDYWDGDRRYGYGGYRYDGRWEVVAEDMIQHYGLRSGHKILDVGCGGGGSLTRFLQLGFTPQNLYGIDIMEARIDEAKEKFPNMNFTCDDAAAMPYESDKFDLVVESTMFVPVE